MRPRRCPPRPAPVVWRRTGALRRNHLISAWLISSALIAWGLVGFPIPTTRSSTSVNAAPTHPPALPPLTLGNSVPRGSQHARTPLPNQPDPAAMPATKRSVGKGGPTIPIGCDGAFSRLVAHGNVTARCVT
jgi:hypothetical protein